MIAVDDIGAFAVLAFENPQDYLGQALEIAGDELTEPQMVEVMAQVTGRPVTMTQPEGPPPYEDMVAMVNWFNEAGYEADISDLRNRHSGLIDFAGWLKVNQWAG